MGVFFLYLLLSLHEKEVPLLDNGVPLLMLHIRRAKISHSKVAYSVCFRSVRRTEHADIALKYYGAFKFPAREKDMD